MSAKQLPKPQTGIAKLDRHLALVADTLNPILRSVAQAGVRQLLNPFAVAVPTDWVALSSFSNNWVNQGGQPAAAYRQSTEGRVDLIGIVQNSSGAPTVNSTLLSGAPVPDNGAGAAGHHIYAASTLSAGGDAFASLDVQTSGVLRYRTGYTVAAGYLSIDTSYMALNRAPIVPSCFPVDVPHSLPSTPIDVRIASCVDQGNASGMPAFPPIVPQWKLTPGVQNSIRILNIPGLLPLHTYAIQLLASA